MVARRGIVNLVWRDKRAWVAIAVAAAGLLFLSTFQAVVNGSDSPYTTDVGEIQNALPRWGTIHWTAYPLYTFLGSLFVTLLHWVGIAPAAGASLFSALWGAISVGLLVVLIQELDVPGPLAALGALVAATSVSLWMDASLAEVHTMTVALMVATLLLALRFGRSGERRDLLLLALAFSQGVAHQRAVAFLAPAVAVLVLAQWRAIWRALLPALGLCLLAPLTYLYLPLRVWQGATWVFGSPGTWQRVVGMLLDNRAERIISWPENFAEWGTRILRAFEVSAADLSPVLLALGLSGLFALAFRKRGRELLALILAWVPYLLLTGAVWIGRVGDAQLAAHLPVTVVASVGLALLADLVGRRVKWGRTLATIGLAGAVLFLCVLNRPTVLEVTRDTSAETVISTAEQVAPSSDGRPTTFMALWGNDYWALAYARAFQRAGTGARRLPGLGVVDHNADFRTIVDRGDRLLTFSRTFYLQPLSWWEQRLGRVYLSSAALDVVEIALEPPVRPADVPSGPVLDLENGLWIRSAQVSPGRDGGVLVTVYWQAQVPTALDYGVAVHAVANDPPQGAEDVLTQADQNHPVYGLYPTSRWRAGEIVRDHYLVNVPDGVQPRAVRIALYRTDDSGGFINSPWLSLPLGK